MESRSRVALVAGSSAWAELTTMPVEVLTKSADGWVGDEQAARKSVTVAAAMATKPCFERPEWCREVFARLLGQDADTSEGEGSGGMGVGGG